MTRTIDYFSTLALFTEYLHVVNRVLAEHEDELPWRHLLAGADPTFRVGVYSTDPAQPHDHFEVRCERRRLRLKVHGPGAGGSRLRVDRAHLEEVVEDPRRFATAPAALDLDWLRAGLAEGRS